MSVEPSVDHPFFVLNCGWSSCDPQKTFEKYCLTVRQLQVGDMCVSLTKTIVKQKTRKQSRPTTHCASESDVNMPPPVHNVPVESSCNHVVPTTNSSQSTGYASTHPLKVTPRGISPVTTENDENDFPVVSTSRSSPSGGGKSPTRKSAKKSPTPIMFTNDDERTCETSIPINLSRMQNSPKDLYNSGEISPIDLKTTESLNHDDQLRKSPKNSSAEPQLRNPAPRSVKDKKSFSNPISQSRDALEQLPTPPEKSTSPATSCVNSHGASSSYERKSPADTSGSAPGSSRQPSSPGNGHTTSSGGNLWRPGLGSEFTSSAKSSEVPESN